MKEYIEKDAAIEFVKSLIDTMSVCTSIDECLGMKSMKSRALGALHDVPAADVRPVVRGKWIIHKPFDSGRHNCNECIECSVCGTWFGHDCYEISNFCPNCGAKMDGGADDE